MTSVLVVGRGAPAVRTAQACRALGLVPVTVVARSDPQRRHAGPDPVLLGCADCAGWAGRAGYDCVDCVVRAAGVANVDAVHPGWGAVAENPLLARRLAGLGVHFVGPPAAALAVARDKALAVDAAEQIGVPVLPHAVGERAIHSLVDRYGLPVVVKPPDGNQGTGVRVIRHRAELRAALAERTGWYAERYVEDGRVIGVTVAIDAAGFVVRLGERESLLMAGNRKLVEAAPVLDVPVGVMRAVRADAVRLVRALGLRNLATVEFLIHRDGYTFLEVNARLTGGYRICEARTGIDVIALQLHLARGGRLGRGLCTGRRGTHAVQAHQYLCADARQPQWVTRVHLPEPEPGVHVDCTLDSGRPVVFDTITCQVLATASSRALAGDRLARAVAGIELAGLRHHGPDIVDWWSVRWAAITAGSGAR